MNANDWAEANLDWATCAPYTKADAEEDIAAMREAGLPDLAIGAVLGDYAGGNCTETDHRHPDDGQDVWQAFGLDGMPRLAALRGAP